MWITGNLIFLLTFLLAGSQACGNVSDGWKQVGLEERAKRSSIVFHGLAIETLPVFNDQFSYAVQFWLINVYKGSESVGKFLDLDPGSGGVFNLRDRKINVTGFSYKSKCQSSVAPQKYYIIFTELVGNELVAKFDDLFGASAEWSERNERRVWRGVGWDNWSDWGTCSTSCGEGSQERTRKCILTRDNCRGYNKERRRCNMFSCQGAVDPMRLDDRRFFHSSRGEWQRVPGRPAAWRLRPNSYVWVPSSQIFPNKTATHRLGVFPREFSLLVTLKLSPKKPMQGILFSLRSRREENAYLSLELESPGRVRVVHSGKNGTQSVIIPMKLNDGHWHQLSIALQDDNSVRSFFDCSWISTDILKRNELDHPEDADLIIGYLFQGELEQLMIVPNPGAVAQQCSSTKIPIFDPNLLRGDSGNTTKAAESSTERKGKKKNKPKIFVETEQEIVKNYRKGIDLGLPDFSKENGKGIASEESKESDDDGGGGEAAEGSGNGNPFEKARFEIEWSEWSSCSSTCGPGMQTRYSRCVDDGSQLEMCLEAGSERTESRPCNTGPCLNSRSEKNNPPTLPSGVASAAEVDAVTEYPVFTSTSADSNITVTAGNTEKRLTDEIYFPSDVYQPENRTIVGKKHRGGKLHGRKTPFVRSWDILKKKLLRESDSKKSWCSCLNGGTCDQVGNSCLCPEGYSGRFCENVGCQIDCLNGGKCLDSNVCICPSGFHGIRCENPQCNPPCRNGGTCIKPDICLCPPQTTGSYCQKYYCRSPCLNGGSCVGPDQCECPHNATGRNCESPVCEPPCENGATCSPGNWCLCSATSYGIRCERRKCDYVPIKEPFTRGFKRLVSKSNGGSKCDASTWKTCTRTVPEYQTVYKTFYRTVYKCREDLIGDGKEPK